MDLSDDECDLLVAGLALLARDRDDDETRRRCRSLASRMGRNLDDVPEPGIAPTDLARLEHLPDLADEPDGIYFPHEIDEADPSSEAAMLTQLLADCVTNGRHHLATLDHPQEGMVIGCTHCHRYWRTRPR